MKDFDFSGFSIIHNEKEGSGNILREQRLVQKMTQQEVADKAHITLQQYQKFESNSRNIRTASFQLACRVLRALNMDIERFYDWDYLFGEEVSFEDGSLKYVKTGKDINDDVV